MSSPASMTFSVRTHVIEIERLEKHRWRVRIDGRSHATFCSERRARAAGRIEARRLDYPVLEAEPAR